MTRYGYFLAEPATEHGDTFLSGLARRLWALLSHTCPSRVDGVSIWDDGDGTEPTIRTVARDFFRDKEVRFPPGAPFRIPCIVVGDSESPWTTQARSGKDKHGT